MFKSSFFKKRELEALEEEARKFQSRGRYAEAAENYARIAQAYLEENPLIYANHCHEAFRMWLKAKEPAKALEQAQALFHILDDTGWLKRSMEQVLDLKLMIDEFKTAGYLAEAETFARGLNDKLAEFGLMLRPDGHIPSICPSCGAQLPHFEAREEVKCSFCGYVAQIN
jgi:hypothetical protein